MSKQLAVKPVIERIPHQVPAVTAPPVREVTPRNRRQVINWLKSCGVAQPIAESMTLGQLRASVKRPDEVIAVLLTATL